MEGYDFHETDTTGGNHSVFFYYYYFLLIPVFRVFGGVF